MDFGVEIQRREGGLVLRLRGEFDLAAVKLVGGRLHQLIAEAGGDVVVDLSEVHFMDAAGIRLLLGLREAARGHGHRLGVERPSPAIVRILRLARAFDLLGDEGQPNGNGAARSA
jgi:anti-sigma B factor antagonist